MTGPVERRRSSLKIDPERLQEVVEGEVSPFVPLDRSNNRQGSFRGRRLSRENSLVVPGSSPSTPRRNEPGKSQSPPGSVVEVDNEKERAILHASRAARQRWQGRDMASILKAPKRRGGEAAAERAPTLLTKHIVLGGRDDSNDMEVLRRLGISHILNVAVQLPNCFEDTFIYKNIPLHDSLDMNVVDAMPEANAFISHVEEVNGRVLIHCISGVSRSVTVTILHFIMAHRMLLLDAHQYIYSCRPFISPNDGFKLQMAQTEIKVLGFSSVCGDRAGKEWDFYEWNRIRQPIHQAQEASGIRIARPKTDQAGAKGEGDCCRCQ